MDDYGLGEMWEKNILERVVSKRVLILVEGQTEERFVKDVLGPAFFHQELFFHVTILVTQRVKDGPNFKGGVTNFAKCKNDARRLLNSAGGALVTTMLDYYGLPLDFPGWTRVPRMARRFNASSTSRMPSPTISTHSCLSFVSAATRRRLRKRIYHEAEKQRCITCTRCSVQRSPRQRRKWEQHVRALIRSSSL